MESRGRPSEQVVKLDKWVLDTDDSTWYYDKSKSTNGCWRVENKFIAGEKQIKIDKKSYNKMPVAMVFKTSNRSNAKTKIKIWRNTNIDYINSAPKLPGVPECAVILDLLVGENCINSYKLKNNL